MPVDRQTFEAVRQRVIETAPAGLSQEQFNALLDQEVAKAEPNFTSQNEKDAQGNALVHGAGDLAVNIIRGIGDIGIGAAKGAANTAVGLGELVHRIPGVSTAVDALYGESGLSAHAFEAAHHDLKPANTAQRLGFNGEQLGEFFLPVGAAGKLGTVAEIGKSALLTGAQGGSKGEAAIAGGLSAVLPGAGTIKKAGEAIGEAAEPLVRAAIKPTVSAMKQIAGASMEGIDAQAKRLVRFIIDNKITTASKARGMVQAAESDLQRVLRANNAPTDAPQRAVRYLEALERQASKQGLPATDVAVIRNAAAEVLETGLGKDVVVMVPAPHPTLLGPDGRPITVMVPKTSRALRTDVMADEALDRARATSRWDTRKSWGEQKGAQVEASKAVERAERDAVKAAVPEARPILQRQGQAIQTAKVLDRAEFRAANRDAVSLPAHVMAAGEIASGHLPVLGFAANWLRNNQLRAGIWAKSLSDAIATGNSQKAAGILKRLGVGMTAEEMLQEATP